MRTSPNTIRPPSSQQASRSGVGLDVGFGVALGVQVAVLLGGGDGEGEGVKVAVGSLVLVAVSGTAVLRATGDPAVQADTNKKMAAINKK